MDSQARLLQFERTQAAGLSDRSAREIADAVRAEAAADRCGVRGTGVAGFPQRAR